MKFKEKTYIAIDLKSFYASVECIEKGLDPLKTKLVVADESRTAKTICLAVSPALKAYNIPGRPRLFQVYQKLKNRNVDFIIAPPRMALYLDYSTRVYNSYLKYIAKEDIHVYSIDEVFIDVSSYLDTYNMTGEELAKTLIKEVLKSTGVTATAGIGTNLYLAKVAMDIVAKHIPEDKDGVRIASLDEYVYRKTLWEHTPLTDFWRIGPGYYKKLKSYGLNTMGDIAKCSLGGENDYYNEDFLYNIFGVNAELLIDHAWGYEPVTIADIKSYRPKVNSLCQGQVLSTPYTADMGEIVVKEMADLLVLSLVDKKLCCDQIVLTVGYDIKNLTDPNISKIYTGTIKKDHYGRKVPSPAHGSINLSFPTSSTKLITQAAIKLYRDIINPDLLIRRFNITANRVVSENEAMADRVPKQLSFFSDYNALIYQKNEQDANLIRERKLQEAELAIKKKYGKNAILKGTNLLPEATMKDRNSRIGGHKA